MTACRGCTASSPCQALKDTRFVPSAMVLATGRKGTPAAGMYEDASPLKVMCEVAMLTGQSHHGCQPSFWLPWIGSIGLTSPASIWLCLTQSMILFGVAGASCKQAWTADQAMVANAKVTHYTFPSHTATNKCTSIMFTWHGLQSHHADLMQAMLQT